MSTDADLAALKIERTASGAKPRRRRWWLYILIILIALLGLGAALMTRGPVAARTFQVPAAETSQDILLSATGYIVAKDAISISPEVAGKVVLVGPDVGEPVETGQVLFAIDSTFYAADYGAAAAQLDELQNGARPDERNRARALRDEAYARLLQLDDDARRQETLLAEGAVSIAQRDAVRRDRDAAAARLVAMDADLRLTMAGPRSEQVRQAADRASAARASLDRTVIRSPVRGTVVRREISTGEYVIAGQGVGLRDMSTPPPYVVADLGRMEAIVEVAERELTRVAVGMPARIRPDALPDSAFAGVIERITPFAYRQKGTIELRVTVLAPSPLLKHDMNARIEFVRDAATASHAPTIRIPAAALRSDAEGPFVLVVAEDGTLQRRGVRATPVASGTEVIVQDGLFGGERLALDAGLSAGDRIAP